MDHIQADLTEPECWPECDIYFKAGISVLQEKLKANGNRREYVFLHLNGYTLRNYLSFFPTDKDGSIVIISSPRLLPLAHFWMKNHHKVCAVFDSGIDIETIVKILMVPSSNKMKVTVKKYIPEITSKDIDILQHYLTTGNMDSIQRRYSRSYTTVQQWKSKLACKLGIRKLEYLTLRS